VSSHSVGVAAEGLLNPFGYGVGYQDFVPLTTPAAGANLSFTVEGRAWVRLLAARCSITTSATVANRFVSLDYVNGRTVTQARNAAGLVVTASTTALVFEWSSSRSRAEWATNTPVLVPLLPIFLAPGTVVQITVDNIQAADQISAASLTLERFDTGALGYAVGFVDGVAIPSESVG
jgi:hypothetical protein